MGASGDWIEIWQERGPLEDLFPVASTDALGELLDAWPFGCGRFLCFAADPADGPGGPRPKRGELFYTGVRSTRDGGKPWYLAAGGY
jgi:hypothetical protein